MTAATVAPMLSVRQLGKSFAGVHALRDVSLDLMPGSVHARHTTSMPSAKSSSDLSNGISNGSYSARS